MIFKPFMLFMCFMVKEKKIFDYWSFVDLLEELGENGYKIQLKESTRVNGRLVPFKDFHHEDHEGHEEKTKEGLI